MSTPEKSASCADAYLTTPGLGRSICDLAQGSVVYRQGDTADTVFYVLQGHIMAGVVSPSGKQAIIGLFSRGEFFGEECLQGRGERPATAMVIANSRLVRLSKFAMMRVLREEPTFAECFRLHLLRRNDRIRDDLVDQLINCSEKRLARALLHLADLGDSETKVLHVSQSTLAEIVGTTRPRICHFMSKFRKLGFISYDGQLRVHDSLRTVIEDDVPSAARAIDRSGASGRMEPIPTTL